MRYACLVLLFFTSPLIGQVPPVFDSLQVYFSTTLYFDSGSATLDTNALRILAQCPSPANRSEQLYLTGHTDDIGSIAYNEDLAIQRAVRAKAVLQTQGWADSNILIQTFGERTPIATNTRADGRRQNRRVTLDFYQKVPYRKLSGRVVESTSNTPIPGALARIHGRTFSDTLSLDSLGRFSLSIPIDSVVGIEVYAKGYFLADQMIKMRPKTIAEIPFELQVAEAGTVADIEALFFVGGQAILLPKSAPALPKVLRFMQINSHLRIEIAGHVNYPNRPPVTEDTFEWDLSIRRAKLVYDYLIENGISAEKLTYQGYGNHEMRFPNAISGQDQQANRRVEIRVLEVRE